jgi:RNA polymerase sigma factor (sigma-70 family)
MKREQEEKIFVQKILDGNPRAQEEFYNEYKKIIKNYIKKKFPKMDAGDVDDYVSEILIKIFYSLNKYDPEKSGLKTWVLAIARHYIIDVWRRNSVTPTSMMNVISGQYLMTTSGSSEWADVNVFTTNTTNNTAFSTNMNYCTTCSSDFENCNSVNYISTQISAIDFSLLNMKYMQGYDYNEIGKEFNLTSNTISNKINYIKTKLKKNNFNIT